MELPLSGNKTFHRREIASLLGMVLALGFAVCLGSCAALQEKEPRGPVFLPQRAMESQNYDSFFKDNQSLLATCGAQGRCDGPLFNLGFLHAYSKSPYYDRPEALKYFARIVKEYPRSPLAYASLVWMDLITENVTLDKQQRELKRQVRSKNAAIKSRNATIHELRDQMKRSRDIDVEMGQKEREVLY